MTNSPPANVNPPDGSRTATPEDAGPFSWLKLQPGEAARVLGSGVDSLVLAMTLLWRNDLTFAELRQAKKLAKEAEKNQPIRFSLGEGAGDMVFEVLPHGREGFEWLIRNHDVSIALGNWCKPKERPSAMVTFRSEALWTHGPDACVARIEALFRAVGAEVLMVKPSRIDLCVDVLLREEDWHVGLDQHFVTRARGTTTYRSSRVLSGFSIGKGAVSARLYDKAREIREKSGKEWMHDVWNLPAVPHGHRVVRVEYQLRREALRQSKIHSWEHVHPKLGRLWAYCANRWLRLVVDARLHHTQQKPLAWWSVVEKGFERAQGATPIVREKAMNRDRRRLRDQSLGTLSSLAAIELARDGDGRVGATLDARSFLHSELDQAIDGAGLNDQQFARRVERKVARFLRTKARSPGDEVQNDSLEVESAPDSPEDCA